jgi:hypothetical protein
MIPQAAAASPETPRRATWARVLARHAGVALLFVSVAGLLQLLTPFPWDADTAYHVAVSRLIARHGILHAFPWTPFSVLAEQYADKELLFHLLLVPLAGLSWSTAAKLVGALLGGALLTTLYRLLEAERVPRATILALLPLALSGGFVLRFALVRPHLVSIALALVVAWAASRRRLVPLAIACALFPWCYVAWHVPVVLVGLAEAARVLGGHRAGARPLLAAAGGLAAGLAVHPNFPEVVRFAWIVSYEILVKTAWAGRAGISLGGEFEPYAPGDAVRFLLLPLLLVAAALVLAWRRRREDPAPLGLALAALAYAALALRSSRFVEYVAPFSVLAAAVAARPLALPRQLPALALAGAALFTGLFGAAPLRALATRGEDLPPEWGALFRRAIPEDAQVFTCDWGLTGELLLELPERRLMVALDPTLFLLHDPERYSVWFRLPRDPPPDAAERIRRTFGAEHVLCARTPASARLFPVLRADPSVRRVIDAPRWFYADLGPAPRPPPAAAAP